jgi:hypothetical protein
VGLSSSLSDATGPTQLAYHKWFTNLPTPINRQQYDPSLYYNAQWFRLSRELESMMSIIDFNPGGDPQFFVHVNMPDPKMENRTYVVGLVDNDQRKLEWFISLL